MTLYIYANEDGLQMDAIDGEDNAECEGKADQQWGSNDYHWSYCDVTRSNAI